jgi:hypothetical protein
MCVSQDVRGYNVMSLPNESENSVIRQRPVKASQTDRWKILAWLCVFIGSQVFSLGHLHADSTSEPDCVVCNHADNTPIADTSGAGTSVGFQTGSNDAARSQSWQPQAPSPYFSRAPPLI